MDFFASGSKPQHPPEWDIWRQLPRPRLVRMQKRQRFRIALILTAAIAIATLLLGAVFAKWQTHPTRQMMETDILRAVPLIGGGLFLPLIFHFFLKRDRRLLSQGELTIAKIVGVHVGGGHVGLGPGGRTVTYECLDHSGRPVTASCPDNTGSFKVWRRGQLDRFRDSQN